MSNTNSVIELLEQKKQEMINALDSKNKEIDYIEAKKNEELAYAQKRLEAIQQSILLGNKRLEELNFALNKLKE